MSKNTASFRKLLDLEYKNLKVLAEPHEGWLKTIRNSLNIPLSYLSRKLDISTTSVFDLEKREAHGSITINKIKIMAEAMDCEFHYFLIPRNRSLEKLMYEKAKIKALKNLAPIQQTMLIEDQEVNKDRFKILLEEEIARLIEKNSNEIWQDG
jgi:predicted DNA-binding mobile mystery protein A